MEFKSIFEAGYYFHHRARLNLDYPKLLHESQSKLSMLDLNLDILMYRKNKVSKRLMHSIPLVVLSAVALLVISINMRGDIAGYSLLISLFALLVSSISLTITNLNEKKRIMNEIGINISDIKKLRDRITAITNLINNSRL